MTRELYKCPQCGKNDLLSSEGTYTLHCVNRMCEDYNMEKPKERFIIGHGFTPLHLQKLKDLVRHEIQAEIRITKAIYEGIGGASKAIYPFEHWLTRVGGEKLILDTYEYETNGELDLSELRRNPKVKQIGKKLMFKGLTKEVGRADRFHKLLVWEQWYVPVDLTHDELEAHTKLRTKTRLIKMMMPPDSSPYNFTIDCKLMELFKEGEMPMSEVVYRSNGDCEL